MEKNIGMNLINKVSIDMKLQFILSNGVKRLNVQYNSILRKHKNKTFPEKNYKELLDFAVGIITDRYISSCPLEIYEWAKENNHPILFQKRWDFC